MIGARIAIAAEIASAKAKIALSERGKKGRAAGGCRKPDDTPKRLGATPAPDRSRKSAVQAAKALGVSERALIGARIAIASEIAAAKAKLANATQGDAVRMRKDRPASLSYKGNFPVVTRAEAASALCVDISSVCHAKRILRDAAPEVAGAGREITLPPRRSRLLGDPGRSFSSREGAENSA